MIITHSNSDDDTIMKRYDRTAGRLLAACILLLLPTLKLSAQEPVGSGTDEPIQVTDEPIPVIPSYSERILSEDSLVMDLSEEALRIIGRPMELRLVGYRPSAGLFAPLLFDLWKLPSLQFDKAALVRNTDPRLHNPFTHRSMLREVVDRYAEEWYPETGFAQGMDLWETGQSLREHFFFVRPDLVPYTSTFLPADRLEYKPIVGPSYSGELEITDMPNVPTRSEGVIDKVTVGRRYWIPKFEGHAQFAQNTVSPNWHKGGNNSANLSSRIFYQLDYKKDKVQWINEIEYKLGLFTVPVDSKDEERTQKVDMRIGEDVFRFRSNFGLQAWKRWFYTIDVNLRSQLLKNRDQSGTTTTMAFAPLILDAGVGMKYDLERKAIGNNPFNNLTFSLNVAPASAQFISIWSDEVSHGRYGLEDGQEHLIRLGSSVRANLNWQFSEALFWRSRLYYNTSYHHIETELENTMEYAFNKYFSIMLSLNLRFDDSVIIDGPKDFKSLLQYNELLSFGFSIKL